MTGSYMRNFVTDFSLAEWVLYRGMQHCSKLWNPCTEFVSLLSRDGDRCCPTLLYSAIVSHCRNAQRDGHRFGVYGIPFLCDCVSFDFILIWSPFNFNKMPYLNFMRIYFFFCFRLSPLISKHYKIIALFTVDRSECTNQTINIDFSLQTLVQTSHVHASKFMHRISNSWAVEKGMRSTPDATEIDV